MKRRIAFSVICFAILALIIGCASAPAVVTPPTVTVSELKSLSFTPTLMKFEAKILITNTMSAGLELQRVDFASDLWDQQAFADSWNGVKPIDGGGNETVTFPFQITMPDLTTLASNILAEGNLRVIFRGQLFAAPHYGMQPIPFSQTLTIPIPKLPEVSYSGTSGEPFSGAFQINLQMKNPDSFPFTLTSVKSFLVINGRKYSLLHTRNSLDFLAGETKPVVLRMETPPGKALSMALNLAQNPNPQFNITGEVTFNTPYGWIFIPLDLMETLQ